MWVKKEQGNCSIGPYVWAKDGDIIEVDDEFGIDLVSIKGNDCTEVIPKNLAEEELLRQPPARTVSDLGVPLGAAREVLDWVRAGDDPKVRAEIALKHEMSMPDGGRAVLKADLNKIIMS